jgi:hypothetical protein
MQHQIKEQTEAQSSKRRGDSSLDGMSNINLQKLKEEIERCKHNRQEDERTIK